jgi:hypothetical protein
MAEYRTICEARRKAHWHYERGKSNNPEVLVERLMTIIDAMWNMGQRMEGRLIEYKDFVDDLQNNLNTVRRCE